MVADTASFISMCFCWLQISYRVPYAVKVMHFCSCLPGYCKLSLQVDMCNFQDTQTMDAKQYEEKMNAKQYERWKPSKWADAEL